MNQTENSIWTTAPDWFRYAYHNDSVINQAMQEAVHEQMNNRDTLLLIIKALWMRDAMRTAEIRRLQEQVSITLVNKDQWLNQSSSFSSIPPFDHTGRLFRIKGKPEVHTVLQHWIDNDDCSGSFRMHKYAYRENQRNNNSTAVNAKDCELL
jgi:hypothetical protein